MKKLVKWKIIKLRTKNALHTTFKSHLLLWWSLCQSLQFQIHFIHQIQHLNTDVTPETICVVCSIKKNKNKTTFIQIVNESYTAPFIISSVQFSTSLQSSALLQKCIQIQPYISCISFSRLRPVEVAFVGYIRHQGYLI